MEIGGYSGWSDEEYKEKCYSENYDDEDYSSEYYEDDSDLDSDIYGHLVEAQLPPPICSRSTTTRKARSKNLKPHVMIVFHLQIDSFRWNTALIQLLTLFRPKCCT